MTDDEIDAAIREGLMKDDPPTAFGFHPTAFIGPWMRSAYRAGHLAWRYGDLELIQPYLEELPTILRLAELGDLSPLRNLVDTFHGHRK